MHLGQRSPACKVSCGEHCPHLDGTSKCPAQNVPTCPGSVLPAAWLRLGATAVPWVRQSRFLAVGFSEVWVQVSRQSPRARAALGMREQHPGAGQMPVGFLPERLSCCKDNLETIWKSRSLGAQCRASPIALLSAFNCNELYGSARRGAEPLG